MFTLFSRIIAGTGSRRCSNICTELNVEKYQLRKDANIAYNHPTETHDDVFWSTALTVYGTVEKEPEPFIAIISTVELCLKSEM